MIFWFLIKITLISQLLLEFDYYQYLTINDENTVYEFCQKKSKPHTFTSGVVAE